MAALMIVCLVGGVLSMALSIPLIRGRIPPNGLYGFRVKKTLADPRIWYPVNTYAGKWLLVTGVWVIFAALTLRGVPRISLQAYALGVLAVVVVLLIVGLSMVVRYMNSIK